MQCCTMKHRNFLEKAQRPEGSNQPLLETLWWCLSAARWAKIQGLRMAHSALRPLSTLRLHLPVLSRGPRSPFQSQGQLAWSTFFPSTSSP